MSTSTEAIQELNGRDVGGRQINVSEAKEREPRRGGGGGGFGRRNYSTKTGAARGDQPPRGACSRPG